MYQTILYFNTIRLKLKTFNQLRRLVGFFLLVFLDSPSQVVAAVEPLQGLMQVADYQKIQQEPGVRSKTLLLSRLQFRFCTSLICNLL
jgi:hypothetical protein